MSKVFVVDTNKQPLNAVHPGRARLLLKQGKAAVYRRYPFTLILKRELEQPHLKPLRVKVDPGSKTRGISQELVRFDTQALENPDIAGVQYQQGTRASYEVRAYVLLKWNHRCAYCDARQVPLELDHLQPRAKHGSKRVKGFQTGDLVRAVVTSGTKPGSYVGKVAVRTRGVFNIQTAQGTVTDMQYRFCKVVARSDGYNYHVRKEAALPPAA